MLLLRQWLFARRFINFTCALSAFCVITTAMRKGTITSATSGSCCCRPGRCDRRNAQREHKIEFSRNGDVSCCKPRKHRHGTCDKTSTFSAAFRPPRYTEPLVDIAGVFADQFYSNCTRHCPDTCSGHGHPVMNLQGLMQNCDCNCDEGYDPKTACAKCLKPFHDPETSCGECVSGYGKDTDQQCKPKCTSHDITCNGHGSPAGFRGACTCTCDEGFDPKSACATCLKPFHDPETNCEECLPGYGKDTDGECKQKCTSHDITCNGHGSPAGFRDACTCTCDKGRDPSTECSTCLGEWFMSDDAQLCFHPSSLTMCLITLNEPRRVNYADIKLQRASDGCENADILVVATQELTLKGTPRKKNNRFDKFALSYAGKEPVPGYVNVARCGSVISAGVVVLARKAKREFFNGKLAFQQCDAKVVDLLTEEAWTNSKGSAVLTIGTANGGVLIAASTHGDRKKDEGRLATIKATARLIRKRMQQSRSSNRSGPAIVAWGGDFNPRTPLTKQSEIDDLLAYGATHPYNPYSGGKDPKIEWMPTFDPVRAFKKLAALPDLLGGDARDFATELSALSHGKLVQVDGIRELCPTYRKADGPGVKSSGGNLNNKRVEWRANFACKAPGYEVEYYESPLSKNLKVKWSGSSSRAPSWTERLIVNAGLRSSCGKPGKVPSEDDHDVLYVKCNLNSLLAPRLDNEQIGAKHEYEYEYEYE